MDRLCSCATLNVKYFPFLSFLTPHTTTPGNSLDTHIKDTWPGHKKAPIPDMYVYREKHPFFNTVIQSLNIWNKWGKP